MFVYDTVKRNFDIKDVNIKGVPIRINKLGKSYKTVLVDETHKSFQNKVKTNYLNRYKNKDEMSKYIF